MEAGAPSPTDAATEEILTYARLLYVKGDIVEWRAIKSPEVARGWVEAQALPGERATLARLNRDGYNIYLGANPRSGRGRTGDESVACCRTGFVDFDHIPLENGAKYEDFVRERIEAADLPPASMIVLSGHGAHAYWRLLSPLDPGPWVKLQEGLIATLDTDRVIRNPERIMRLPGFLNVKAEPVLCRIAEYDCTRRYDPDGLLSLCKQPEPPAPPQSAGGKQPAYMEAKARAMLYAAKWRCIAEGQGRNNDAYVHSCTLYNDFDLPEADAWEILSAWNQGNSPPLDERELRTAFDSAKKRAKHPAGSKLTRVRPRRERYSDEPPPEDPDAEPQAAPTQPKDATAAVGRFVEGVISGEIETVPWPFPVLSANSEALLAGTVTVLSGSKGATKTLMLLQSLRFWVDRGYSVAYLAMEEDVEHCLRRCLAQVSECAGITRPSWIAENAEHARKVYAENQGWLSEIAPHLYDLSDADIGLPAVARWIERQAEQQTRIIVVDPVTAATQTGKPWVCDPAFINGVKRLARAHKCSVVLATHPRKGAASVVEMDSLSGSAAYIRFTQTIFWLQAHDPKPVQVQTIFGRNTVDINRTLHILAARNAGGAGQQIGYWFDVERLTLEEIGQIMKG